MKEITGELAKLHEDTLQDLQYTVHHIAEVILSSVLSRNRLLKFTSMTDLLDYIDTLDMHVSTETYNVIYKDKRYLNLCDLIDKEEREKEDDETNKAEH